VSCVSEGPPLSQLLLRAGLERKGVRLLDGVSPDPGAVFGRIQKAVRGRRFDAVILVGPGMVSRWARPLRLLIPRQVMFHFFPDASTLTDPLERFSVSARQGVKSKWRDLLSLADGVWARSGREAERLARCFRLDPARLEALPASWDSRAERWVAAAMARRSGLRKALSKAVAAAVLDATAAEAEELRGAVARVTGRRPGLAVLDGAGGVRALNRFLDGRAWTYALICLHPMVPSENLVRTLLEGMHVLPYAGAAVPVDFSAVRGRGGGALPVKEGLFAAAWAMQNKGNWHEVDYVSHCCCLVLRRDAWEECGRLDERFCRTEPAWTDYFLRLQQAGRPVLLAQDALARCRSRGPDPQAGVEDRDLLIEKWCKGSLKLMESLLTSLEPDGYRSVSKKIEESV